MAVLRVFGLVLRVSSIWICLLIIQIQATFLLQTPTIQAYFPTGLKVSIPDQTGIKSFSFHGQINKRLNSQENGTFSPLDVTKPVDGYWTYQDKFAQVKLGDTIYYWIIIDYVNGTRKESYVMDNQRIVIKELIQDTTTVWNDSIVNKDLPSSSRLNSTTKAYSTLPVSSTTENPKCRYTPTIANGKRSCQGKLLYQDFFETLSETRWQAEVKFSSEPDYEFVIYQNDKENLYIKNNVLHIKPTLTEDRFGTGSVSHNGGLDLGDNCTGILGSRECVQKPKAWSILPPVISAQISTRHKFSFIYGIVEVRARLPKGDWIYPQVHLRSESEPYGPAYESGLIRIASLGGNSIFSKQLLGGIILGQSIMARNRGLKGIRSEKNWNADFHVFRVEWKPDGFILSVDGKIYGAIYPPEGGFTKDEQDLGIDPEVANRWRRGSIMAPFDREMFLAFGVGVGGISFTDRIDGLKPWSNNDPKAQLHFYRDRGNWSKTWSDSSELLVDSVKVWAL